MDNLGKLKQHFGNGWFTLKQAAPVIVENPQAHTYKVAKVLLEAAQNGELEATDFHIGWKYSIYYLGTCGNKFRFISK